MSDPDAELDAYMRAERVANDYHPDTEHPPHVTLLYAAATQLRAGPGTAVAVDGCARLLEEVGRARHLGHPMSPELAQAADEVARLVMGAGTPPP